MSDLYIGVMSGTSLDGADAVLADFSFSPPKLIGHSYESFNAALRATLLELSAPGANELDQAARTGIVLSRCYAKLVRDLLEASGHSAPEIAAIGCHGQTIRHRPELGYSVQLGNPALLAELTGIAVVSDFRSRDIAAGGQGAPLVPAFHDILFRHPTRHRIIVNAGGIANITDLDPSKPTSGFDCGPGNLLMDAWVLRHRGCRYDLDGTWAAAGIAIPELLEAMLSEPYFSQPPPKSTGRDLFNYEWLERHLTPRYRPADVQATLLALTVTSIARAIRSNCPAAQGVYICGGGARNRALLAELARALPEMKVQPTDELGIDCLHVEALAFAWLARQALKGEAGNLPHVTGASHACVLGAIYPR